MQCKNIASRTNGAGCIYTEYARTIYIYRQFSNFTTSVGLAALAPIIYENCTVRLASVGLAQARPNYEDHSVGEGLLPECSVGDPERR